MGAASMIPKLVQWLFIILVGSALSACSFSTMRKTTIHITAVRYLNPDINGKAAPVELRFYQLKSAFIFKRAHFYALQNKAEAILKTSLISKKTQEVRPQQKLAYTFSLPLSTHFIGITAGFRRIDQALWRVLLPIPRNQRHWYHRWARNAIYIRVNLYTQKMKAYLVQ